MIEPPLITLFSDASFYTKHAGYHFWWRDNNRSYEGTGHQWEGVVERIVFSDGELIPYFWQSKGSIIHARYNNTDSDEERFEDIISKVIKTLPAERPRNFAEI